LRRARDLLGERAYDTSETVLACYSGAGFSREIAEDVDGERIALIGPRELYGDVGLAQVGEKQFHDRFLMDGDISRRPRPRGDASPRWAEVHGCGGSVQS
jgi:hypothetical protein